MTHEKLVEIANQIFATLKQRYDLWEMDANAWQEGQSRKQ